MFKKSLFLISVFVLISIHSSTSPMGGLQKAADALLYGVEASVPTLMTGALAALIFVNMEPGSALCKPIMTQTALLAGITSTGLGIKRYCGNEKEPFRQLFKKYLFSALTHGHVDVILSSIAPIIIGWPIPITYINLASRQDL